MSVLMQQTDLLSLPENPDKNAGDYIIADLHGNHEVFNALLERCALAGDRIFLAGDLADRGVGNVDIFRAIVASNNDPNKRKIYCVRGNHEDMCVKTINALTELTSIQLFGTSPLDDYSRSEYLLNLYVWTQYAAEDKEIQRILNDPVIEYFLAAPILAGKKIFDEYFENADNLDLRTVNHKVIHLRDQTDLIDEVELIYGAISSLYEDIACHRINGGQWLIDLYVDEFINSIISAGDNFVEFDEHSEIAMIYDYLESLPYIIRVAGKYPFFIVHGDMPISEEVFLQRIINGEGLSVTEQEYAMWARAERDAEIKIIRVKGRNKFSCLAAVGHTIDGGVRIATNTVNLDVSSFTRNCAVVITMPAREAFIIKSNPNIEVDAKVQKICTAVQRQLDKQDALAVMRAKRDRIKAKSPGMFQAAVESGEPSKRSASTLPSRRKLGF